MEKDLTPGQLLSLSRHLFSSLLITLDVTCLICSNIGHSNEWTCHVCVLIDVAGCRESKKLLLMPKPKLLVPVAHARGGREHKAAVHVETPVPGSGCEQRAL